MRQIRYFRRLYKNYIKESHRIQLLQIILLLDAKQLTSNYYDQYVILITHMVFKSKQEILNLIINYMIHKKTTRLRFKRSFHGYTYSD